MKLNPMIPFPKPPSLNPDQLARQKWIAGHNDPITRASLHIPDGVGFFDVDMVLGMSQQFQNLVMRLQMSEAIVARLTENLQMAARVASAASQLNAVEDGVDASKEWDALRTALEALDAFLANHRTNGKAKPAPDAPPPPAS